MKGQAMTDTRQVLEEAWEHLCQTSLSFRRYACTTIPGGDGWTMTGKFCRFLDAEAWTDAAMMLVPEGWLWEVQWIGHQTKGRVANAHIWKRFDQSHFAAAAHPALALAQACLKARDNSDG